MQQKLDICVTFNLKWNIIYKIINIFL